MRFVAEFGLLVTEFGYSAERIWGLLKPLSGHLFLKCRGNRNGIKSKKTKCC